MPDPEPDYYMTDYMPASELPAIQQMPASSPYPDSYWECDRGHKFDHGELRGRSRCPTCKSQMIKWVPKGEMIH